MIQSDWYFYCDKKKFRESILKLGENNKIMLIIYSLAV